MTLDVVFAVANVAKLFLRRHFLSISYDANVHVLKSNIYTIKNGRAVMLTFKKLAIST